MFSFSLVGDGDRALLEASGGNVAESKRSMCYEVGDDSCNTGTADS